MTYKSWWVIQSVSITSGGRTNVSCHTIHTKDDTGKGN